MTTRHPINLAILSLLLLAGTAPAAESLSVLLQKGIYAEETEGNLDAAIQIYQKIAGDAEANRSVVAQAQYRLGVCELKRGKKEQAEAAFRKITSQFADQADISAKARERLGEMGLSASSVVLRQVWSGKGASGGSISQDGRYLAFTDWDTGNLAVRDLATGQNRRLTEQGSWGKSTQYAETCAFSHNGKQVAYSWSSGEADTESGTYGLHVVNLENGTSRVLINQQTNRWIGAGDWSPDGKWVAVFGLEWETRPQTATNWYGTILLANAEDGSVRKLAPVTSLGRVSDLRFSPDGRFLAYHVGRSRHIASQPSTNDIFVLEVRSGTVKLAVEYFANERFVAWAPRGSEILFTSERRGTTDLWSVPVEHGEAKGPPVLLKADFGNARPIGITQNGSFFFSTDSSSYADVRHARIDFGTGKLLQPVETLPIRSTGRIISVRPGFQGDGRYLALLGQLRGEKQFLSIFDLQTRQQWMLDAFENFSERNTPSWVWDQSTLLVRGVHKKTGNGWYLIDPTSGAVTTAATETPGYTIQRLPGGSDANSIYSFERSKTNRSKVLLTSHDLKEGSTKKWEFDFPDKRSNPFPYWKYKAIFYVQEPLDLQQGFWVARRFDFDADRTLELYRSRHPISGAGPCCAPTDDEDKDALVFTQNEIGQKVVKFLTINSDAVSERLTVTLPPEAKLRPGTTDGRYFLFEKPLGSDKQSPSELWAFSQETGQMTKTELVLPAEADRLEVGAHDVTFLVRKSNVPELWVMENFLPPVAAAK